MKNLSEMMLLLSIICEKLEKLEVLSEDPRVSSNKQKDIKNGIISIIELFLGAVSTNQVSSIISDRLRLNISSSANLHECISKINEVCSDYKQRID